MLKGDEVLKSIWKYFLNVRWANKEWITIALYYNLIRDNGFTHGIIRASLSASILKYTLSISLVWFSL